MVLEKACMWEILKKINNCDNTDLLPPTIKLAEWELFNPFPTKGVSLHFCSTSLLKTLWEKEKLLITNNFSFSNSVF